jgi:hypothetical protein
MGSHRPAALLSMTISCFLCSSFVPCMNYHSISALNLHLTRLSAPSFRAKWHLSISVIPLPAGMGLSMEHGFCTPSHLQLDDVDARYSHEHPGWDDDQ